MSAKSVMPADLERYLNWQRRAYQSRHGREPHDENHWRSYYTAGIHHLLHVTQGKWPPQPDFAKHLNALREALNRAGFSPSAIRSSFYYARRFLRYLAAHDVSPEEASPKDVGAFLQNVLRTRRRTMKSPPHVEIKWRRHYRKTIHRLLEYVQGEWPPASPAKALLKRFMDHLVERGIPKWNVYNRPARLFIDYLEERSLDAAKVQPSDVAEYFRVALKLSKRRHPNLVERPDHWRRMVRRTVHAILRFVQGEWPPGSRPSPLVGTFRDYLEHHQYSYGVVPASVASVNQFLRHLHRQGKPIKAARPADVAAFVEEKRRQYEKRHRRPPPSEPKWRYGYTGPIHRMLRLVDAEWPRPEPPRSEAERLQRDLLEGYGRWLTDDYGLSEATRRKNCDDAKNFLSWWESSGRSTLMDLTVTEIDAYLAWRLAPFRRTTRAGICNALRSFLRYLHYKKLISRDLAPNVMGPHLYQCEEIPRAFSEDQVRVVLRCTRRDHRPIGLRDHAMLLLLATYGLRAGEVLHLRLEDIDWREERLRIRHSKTGYESLLPLVAPVGEALLAYLKKGRPKTALRQVFLQAIAPYQAFKLAGTLRTIIQYRLQKAGIKATGHQGAHAFRFARAHSLLCASVPRKVIGDLFGHRNPNSTAVYLKLVTDDLREIGIDLPIGTKKCQPGQTKKKRS
jgi:site-specific recombinase XerD